MKYYRSTSCKTCLKIYKSFPVNSHVVVTECTENVYLWLPCMTETETMTQWWTRDQIPNGRMICSFFPMLIPEPKFFKRLGFSLLERPNFIKYEWQLCPYGTQWKDYERVWWSMAGIVTKTPKSWFELPTLMTFWWDRDEFNV